MNQATLMHLAKEAARAASMHGPVWAAETGQPPWTANDVQVFVVNNAIYLDTSQLVTTVTYSGGGTVTVGSDVFPQLTVVHVQLTYLGQTADAESVISY